MLNKLLFASLVIAGAFVAQAAQKNEMSLSNACEEARTFMEKNRSGIKNLLNQATDNSDVKLLFDLGKFQVEMLETQLAKKENAVFLCENILKKIKRIISEAATIEKIMNTKEAGAPPAAKEEAEKTVSVKEEAAKVLPKKKGCPYSQSDNWINSQN